MAYLNFSEAAAGRAAPARFLEPAPRSEPAFSALEWSVVALAQRDSLSSLSEPGRISTALGVLFGAQQNPRLADPQLEALRRMSVLAWHKGYAVAPSEVEAFHEAGFSPDQYELLVNSIGRGRAANSRKH